MKKLGFVLLITLIASLSITAVSDAMDPNPLTWTEWEMLVLMYKGDGTPTGRIRTRCWFEPLRGGPPSPADGINGGPFEGMFWCEHFGVGKYGAVEAAGKISWHAPRIDRPDQLEHRVTGEWRYARGSRWMTGYIWTYDLDSGPDRSSRWIARLTLPGPPPEPE